MVDNGVRPVHINVDCVDGPLQVGSQVDAREESCWDDDLWLCFGDLCLVCFGAVGWISGVFVSIQATF